jgi:hypothetical protein
MLLAMSISIAVPVVTTRPDLGAEFRKTKRAHQEQRAGSVDAPRLPADLYFHVCEE